MKRYAPLLTFAFLMILACAPLAAARAQEPPPDEKLRIGIKRIEPFVFIDEDGAPTGFSIDLWNAIASDLSVNYEWVQTGTITELIEDVRSGGVDAAISGVSLTPEREAFVDFSYPYFDSGLQIMIPASPDAGVVSLVEVFFSSTIFKLLELGLLILIVMAHVIWLMERGSNPEIPQSYFAGVWEGLWWGLKMLMKQEYLDQVKPSSKLKRLFVMIWMIFGIILIAEFTASITATQTVQQLKATIEGPADLQGKRVVTVAGSTAEAYLVEQELRYTAVERIEEAYEALLNDETDAIVFDAPVLLHYAQTQGYGLVDVVGPIFNDESYGIALPSNSELREPINRALLRLKHSGRYDTIYRKWFGASE